jgi:hypothetical protein
MNAHISQTLESLKKSTFRSKFKLSKKDRQYIQDKGIEAIRQHATAEETVIYDNGFDQAISGGAIVVHTKTK